MVKIYLRSNLYHFMASIFLFLFAIEPLLDNIKILYYIVISMMMLCVAIWLLCCVKSMVKDKLNFISSLTSKSIFPFFDIASSVIGLIISYSLNSNLFKLWIFLLVLNIIFILIPNPYKRH